MQLPSHADSVSPVKTTNLLLRLFQQKKKTQLATLSMRIKQPPPPNTPPLLTHDDEIGHALEGGLLNLGDGVFVDAQLLQTLGHVGRHLLEEVPGQVESLELHQGAEGLGVDDSQLVVHQDQGLGRRNRRVC